MANTAMQLNESLTELLSLTAAELDIDRGLDQRLTASYQDLGNWLKRDSQSRYTADAEVYAQGSKRLGTLTASVGANDDVDVDIVYRRDLLRTSISQQELKASAGDQLERYIDDRRRRALDVPEVSEGSRCWTLWFRGYHLDILPALPDDGHYGHAKAPDAIIITDKNLRNWQSSNPKAYSRWFKKRMEVALRDGRAALAKVAGVDVESIPEHDVKTPLQIVVQLLKRHRDLFYAGHPDDKPISIIISTLAAHAYDNQVDLFAAVHAIANGMHTHIYNIDGVPWVPNPTNPDENFADKWRVFPERAARFRDWLALLRSDINGIASEPGLDKIAGVLSRSFGKMATDNAMKRLGTRTLASRSAGTLRSSSAGALGSVGVSVPNHTFFGDGE